MLYKVLTGSQSGRFMRLIKDSFILTADQLREKYNVGQLLQYADERQYKLQANDN